MLLIVARLIGGVRPKTAGRARSDAWAVLEPLQIAAMFVLTCIGWLMFRETDIHMLIRDLSLSPWAASTDREIGRYLFVLTAIYAAPLWAHDIWSVYIAPALRLREDEADLSWRAVGHALLAGLALAAILVFRSQQSLDFIYFKF
jgi:hypothetical protein